MNQTQNQIGLAGRLQAEAAEKARKAQQEADARMDIAKAWDATGFAGKEPWYISAGGIYGDVGGVSFRDVGPDELAELMRAFPAIPRISYVDGPRYFVPAAARPAPEGIEVEQLDGYEIEVSGGRNYNSLRAGWSTMIGDLQVHFRVELRRVQYLHPRTHRRAVMHGGSFVRYEGPSELIWPDENGPQKELAIQSRSYWKSDDSSGDYRIRGTQVLQLVEAWEAEANRRGADTKAAFRRAYDGLAPLPAEGEVAAQVEQGRAAYEAKGGSGLRAGTLEQTAALETPHALADRAVAERHWIAYAAHHGIDTQYQTYFSHYDWAKSYLKRLGLYEVEHEGGRAKYGSKWF